MRNIYIMVYLVNTVSACSYINGVCFEEQDTNYFVDKKILRNEFPRQVTLNLTSNVTFVVGAVGGSAGYLFEQDRQFTGVPVLADPSILCVPAANADQFEGKVVLIERGGCNFEDKFVLSSIHGPTAVIILTHTSMFVYGVGITACKNLTLMSNEEVAFILVNDLPNADFIRHYMDRQEIVSLTISWAGAPLGEFCFGDDNCAGGTESHTCNVLKCQCNTVAFKQVNTTGEDMCEKLPGVDAHALARRTTDTCNYIYPGGSGCINHICVGTPYTTGCVSDVCECGPGYVLTGDPGSDDARCATEIYPGGSGCTGQICTGFHTAGCADDVCECQPPYILAGDPGTLEARCVSERCGTDTVEQQCKVVTLLQDNDVKYQVMQLLDQCDAMCPVPEECCEILFELDSGDSVTTVHGYQLTVDDNAETWVTWEPNSVILLP